MKDFLIVYGSHTGQAETIAKSIKEKAEVLGLAPRIFELNENEKSFNLDEERLCVIVVSSTGDGDSPDNAARFVRRICRKGLSSDYLKNLEYALLGLGDSNYSSYQAVPKKIGKQLQSLGAKKIIDSAEADDQVGLELAVEPWIDQLFCKLAEKFEISSDCLTKLTESKLNFNPVKSYKEKQALLEEQKKNTRREESDDEQDERMAYPILKPVPFEYPKHSIVKGKDALTQDENLRVPIAPQNFIVSSVTHEKWTAPSSFPWQNGCKMVGVVTEPFDVVVVGTALITEADVVKPKREIVIDFGKHAEKLAYEPGDAMYFVAPNPEVEVNTILKRSGVLEIAENVCELSIHPKTEKINATLPAHLPPRSSLRHLFTRCLDIRRAPGRPLLRVLADSAENGDERRRLHELCSAQGMNDFTAFIRQAGLSLVDVLFAFPSVRPPADRLLELLPRLIPRPYSMSSFNQKRARFIYSEMTFTAEEGRRYPRKGLSTDWLNSLRVGDLIQVLGKEPARFRLPPPPGSREDAIKTPLLMIGPGTGVSVFLSFCHFLLEKKLNDEKEFDNVPRILYFGCRDAAKDAIHLKELKSFVREGILSELVVCESQTNGERVQEGMKKRIDTILPFMKLGDGHTGSTFVCGDAKGMSKDVWQFFCDVLVQGEGLTDAQAKERMLELKKRDRYVEDVWA